MTTKNTTHQTSFNMWDVAQPYADFMLETTQKTFDQSIALTEKMTSMWLDSAKKAQELTLKQTETAFQMAEATQAQMKTASDRMAKMMKDFSVN